MAAIPLPIRKNIRDNEPKMAQHLARIRNATGKEWAVEVDWGTILSQIDASRREQIGRLYYDDALGYIAKNIENLSKNGTAIEAFNEATSTNRIVFRGVADNFGDREHWAINFPNGEMAVWHEKSLFDIGALENFDITKTLPAPGVPLVVKLSLEQNLPKLNENLAKIAMATGVADWTVEADFTSICSQLDQRQNERLGSLYYSDIMGYLATNIAKNFKSEVIREAFNEAVPERRIEIRLNDKLAGHVDIHFENGSLVLSHKKHLNCLSNFETTEIAPKIPSPGIPVLTKISLEQYKPSLDRALEEIKQITGAGDWVVEAEYDTIVPHLDTYAANDLGRSYYNDAIPTFARLLKKKLASETTREAFNEAAAERRIVFRLDNNQNVFWDISFDNGAVVLTHKKGVQHGISDMENFDIEKVIPVPGVLSLMTKLSLEEKRPEMEKHLRAIAKATGHEYTFDEGCFEAFYPKLPDNHRTRLGQAVLDDMLGYLAKNLTKALQDEMVREAFNENASAHQITLRQGPVPNYNWQIALKDGMVVITFEHLSNVSSVESFNIEALL